jgi:hypothetical protein
VKAQDREQMVHELREAYIAWRQACLELEDARRLWGSGHGPEGAEAFERCEAALDEEGRAAEYYARVMQRGAGITGRKAAEAESASPSPGQAPTR